MPQDPMRELERRGRRQTVGSFVRGIWLLASLRHPYPSYPPPTPLRSGLPARRNFSQRLRLKTFKEEPAYGSPYLRTNDLMTTDAAH